jgi:hypothetical protein
MECKTVLPEDLVWVVPNDIPPGAKATVLEGDPCKAVLLYRSGEVSNRI